MGFTAGQEHQLVVYGSSSNPLATFVDLQFKTKARGDE